MSTSFSERMKQLEDLLISATTPQEVEAVERMLADLETEVNRPDEDESLTDLERRRLKTEEAQEIGPLPPIKDPERRARCKNDLRLTLFTYFRKSLTNEHGKFMGLSPYQEEMVAAFQQVILGGGKKARAVRRGGLKSTLARIAAIWAILNGHRKFPVLVGATDDKSEEHRDNTLDTLKASQELQDDFPELVPLLMKRANPKKMLRLDGELLKVNAKDARGCILFPEIAGVESSGARIAPYSMQSTDVSGLSFVDEEGRTVRPDLLIFDDVQTPQSAKSFMMTSKRENAICTTFMGLAALGATIACIMVCTVREANDLTVRFCDRKLHPDWDGQMFPVLTSEPKDKQKWAIYGQKLREGDTPEEGFARATAYYIEHRKLMDEGGKVAWELDKEEGYVSALQWCMTVAILQPEYFRCELQQKGAAPKAGVIQLVAEELITRLSTVPRGIVPASASYLTGFVDSSDHVLWWMVCAWMKDFTGWVVDFGTWPDQQRQQFYKSDLTRMLEHELPGHSWEEAFVNAHKQVDELLLGREWPVQNGGKRQIDKLLKDWSDGDHKKRIEPQVNASPHKASIRPSKGFSPKPGKKPVHLWGDPKRDWHTNSDWIERRTDVPMHVQYNANVWKGNTAKRLRTIVGAPSALLLPGNDEMDLMLLAEHLTAEVAKPIVYDGTPGTVYEQLVDRDNDWWDCLVGNVVAASMLGCALPGETVIPAKKELRTFTLPGGKRG